MGSALSCDLQNILIKTLLSWLTPLDEDFGQFAIHLTSTSIDDDDSTHIDLKSFNLEGMWLHGKISADLPGLGHQELPINFNFACNKEEHQKACKVDVHDFNFEEYSNAEGEAKTRGFDFGDLEDAVGDAVGDLADGGGVQKAMMAVMNQGEAKDWVCQQISDVINEKIQERVGGDDDDEDE